jgi:ABC-type multidrug transport system permease subunit
VLATWGLAAAASSVAVLLGCVVNDVKTASELAPLIFIPQLLFAGFYIRTSLIPVFLRWAQYLCSLKYGINLVMITQISPSTAGCQCAPDACENVLKENNVNPDAWWVYALILLCLFLIFRIIAAVVLVQRAVRFQY